MIEILSMVKNESDFISKFIQHHHRIADKLTIIDNGSTDQTWEIIQSYCDKYNTIDSHRYYCSFQHKARLITSHMVKSHHSLLIPIDSDEIIGYEDDSGEIILDTDHIKQYLSSLAIHNHGKLKIKRVYNYIPESDNLFAIQNHNKFMFLHKDFKSVDAGFHNGLTLKQPTKIIPTNIIYLHFHYRNLTSWLKSTEQKLKARLGDKWNNIEILEQYRKPRPSYHAALEYLRYLQTGKWYDLQPFKRIEHNYV